MASFSELLIRLAEAWPLIVLITVLVVLLTVILALRQVRRAAVEEPAAGRAAGAEELELDAEVDILPPAGLPTPRQIRRTVSVGFRTLRERVTSRPLRFRTPCFLLLGPAGAGKSTLLRQLGPDAVAPADPTRAAGCRWHFYDRAVTIEVDGRLLLPARPSTASERGWEALHRALRFRRPERPIDGIVLALPASDFFGPRSFDEEALIVRARGMFQRLQDAQRALGLRVPLYLIVTKCDLLPGFQDFCDAVPAGAREESFGWANPYALDSAFSAAWIDEAFASLSDDLFRLQVELLAREEAASPEGLFHFSRPFRALHAPLRAFITELCRESTYQESFFFRGIYFTGDGTDDPAERLLDAADREVDVSVEHGAASSVGAAALPPLPATLAVSREPFFLRDFFEKKVFGETGLARTVSRSRLSRNRTILALQAAILAVVLIGGIGVWRGTVMLERERGLLQSVLTDIRSDLQLLEGGAAGGSTGFAATNPPILHQRVFPMLSSMARVNIDRLSSLFLPSSWISSLHWEISESMRQGFTHVVLPSMHEAVLMKADSLVEPQLQATFASTGLSGDELTEYLRAIVHFGENLERYDTVTFLGAEQTELQNISDLVLYLFDEQLPPEFQGNQRYHRIALWESYGQRITPRDRPTFNEDVLRRAESLARGHYDAVIDWLEGIDARFQAAEQTQRLTSADLADFRALRDELTAVERVLRGSESFWFDGSQPVGTSLLALLDSIPETALTAPDRLRGEFEEMFHRVRREKLQELNARLGARMGGSAAPAVGVGGAMGLSPQLVTLQATLDTLFAQPFIANTPAPSSWSAPPPAAQLRWDVAALDRALAEYAQYEGFLEEQRASGGGGASRIVEGLSTVQLEARIGEAVRQAMTTEPPGYAFGLRDRERDLRARVAAFSEPSRRLLQLLSIAADRGMAESYDRIASIYVEQAVGMLAEVDALLEEGRTYQPASATLTTWDGRHPPAATAFGARDAEELESYLEQQRTRARFLVDEFAAPILAGLMAGPVEPYLASSGQTGSGLIGKWARLVEELDRHEAQAGTSSVGVLEEFIRSEMTVADVPACLENRRNAVASGGDYFLLTRNRLRTQLYTRCEQLAAARAEAAYEEIGRYFTDHLAGRYPFAPAEDGAGTSAEAELTAIRHYFELHDLIAPYREALPGAERNAFLTRMDEVRSFLRPLLSDEGERAYSLEVAFRVNREAERGADQIVDWMISVGDGALTYRGAVEPQTRSWRPGAPASLQLRWALQSRERPDGARYASASVADRDAAFRYSGDWALLRLLQNHLAGPPAGALGYLLRFEVPTIVASAAPSPGDDAVVFLRLRLNDPAGDPLPLLPFFPTWAP